MAAKTLLLKVRHKNLAKKTFQTSHVLGMKVYFLALIEFVFSGVFFFDFLDSLRNPPLEKLLLLRQLVIVLILRQHFFSKIRFNLLKFNTDFF